MVTLDDFIIERQKDIPLATGELSGLLRDIGVASKVVHREVNKAGLVDILGEHGSTNIQGETVQKLDIFANEILKRSLMTSGECCGIASEEEDDHVAFEVNERQENARYVVLFDPLDGSSNIDVNVSIGTIFSIYKRISPMGTKATLEDFLQPGTKQVAAGYVIYGSSTMLVYTTGKGVNGFTLDPSIGEFCLSHPDIITPVKASMYSINQGYHNEFSEGVRDYLSFCQDTTERKSKAYKLRYIGSMVADFHRNLIKGGIFLYPPTKAAPQGKLRLMYECNPLAWLAEQAGGEASTGTRRVLEVMPSELHERVSIIIGSKAMVEEAMRIIHK
ncbi:MAG: class 1 fructose-bisphosphatase [Bacteroidetes bacterium]|nr:class 1 fructose-bisphosphatase [Bacteroidota bacterium]